MDIDLRTSSGFHYATARLVTWTQPKLRTTHNGTTRFKYQRGTDVNGIQYETKSRGGGWRMRKNNTLRPADG